ncbi:MAG TPA: alpha/beta hydrolase [Acidimicrobiales bacterium]|nr:alpha/beta hydrolase [Acidimicrobiales bacterium]
MSTIDVRPSYRQGITTGQPSGDATPDGPIARIVVGSVLLGLIGALFLDLVVFGGSSEHVITGSALLAFGAGWTVLAVLSTRMTNQPQQWAFVPAAYMSVVGAALLLFAPGDDGLRLMGWIWPAPVLALAIWIAVGSRRHLQSRTRGWLLYPIVAFLALGALGCSYQTVQSSLDHSTDVMPGQAYDVGGRRLHLTCTGAGSPTVVLQNGLGETSAHWAWITRAVAADTRVCAYDRAGQGWSDDAASPQHAVEIAADLHTLLERANEPGPYVLAGHSSGGPYMLTYAAQYPTDVAGVVLLDATSPRAFTELPDFSGTNATMRRLFGLASSLSRLGLAQLLGAGAGAGLPAPAAGQVDAFATSPRYVRGQLEELSTLAVSLTQAGQLRDLAGKPLAVVTAGEGQQAGWAAAQDRLATLSANHLHRVVPATHSSLLLDETDSAHSARAIADVVRSVRTRSALPAS